MPRNSTQPAGFIHFTNCSPAVISEFYTLGDVISYLADGDANLLHAVTLTHGDAVVGLVGLGADGVEVEGDAEGGADLILTAVALADGAGLVIVDHELLGKLSVKLHGGTCEYLLL